MNRRKFIKKILAGIVLASSIPLISGCGKNPVEVEPESILNSNSIIKDNIEYYLQTDKKIYSLGENVEMLYRVSNKRKEDVYFQFSTSKQYHFRVMSNGATIWEMSKGAYLWITDFTLKPNQSKEFNETWSQVDEDGKPVVEGNYKVIGELYLFINSEYYTPVSVPIEIIQ